MSFSIPLIYFFLFFSNNFNDFFSSIFSAEIGNDPTPTNPCVPSPCGPFSVCQENNSGFPACSCLANYIGSPPNCRPECSLNSECRSDQACIREKCADPCPGSCGNRARCTVVNHTPICTCFEAHTGDPFSNCYPRQEPTPKRKTNFLHSPLTRKKLTILYYFSCYNDLNTLVVAPGPRDPCDPSPCGPNARCQAGACTCLPEYHGDPYYGCRPECVQNYDCPLNRACLNNKCVDPCPGVCGRYEECQVINHNPICRCTLNNGNSYLPCEPPKRKSPNGPQSFFFFLQFRSNRPVFF